MEQSPEPDREIERILLAGQHVAPGAYRNVETGCCIEFEEAGRLPPSFDGRVACYVPVPRTWRQHVLASAAADARPAEHEGSRGRKRTGSDPRRHQETVAT